MNVPAEVAEAPAPVEETAAAPEAAPEATPEAPAPEEAPAPVPAIPTREMVAIPEAAPVPETKVFFSTFLSLITIMIIFIVSSSSPSLC